MKKHTASIVVSLYFLSCGGASDRPKVLSAEVSPGLPIQARGRAALDLVQDPSILVGPLLTAVDRTLREIDEAVPTRMNPRVLVDIPQALVPFRRLLLGTRALLVRAHVQLPDGAVCAADESLVAAGQSLGLLLESAKAAERLLGAIRDPDTAAGDATDQGGRLAIVHYFSGRFAQTAADARDAEGVVRSLCRSLGLSRTIAGKIVKVDDAKRRVRLADGTILGLRETREQNPVSAGGRISAQARFFPDGSGFASVYNVEVLKNGDVSLIPCIGVRVAPVQPFPLLFANGTAPGTNGRAGLPAPLPGAGPYRLHRIAGYEQALNLHYFEIGMRMAAVKQACLADNADTPEHFHRYSLEIAFLVGGDTYTVADQLEPGDAPAPFPPNTPVAGPSGTLRVRTKVQDCTLVVGLTPFESRLSSDEVKACNPVTTECACDPRASYCPVLPDFDDFISQEPYDCTVPQYLSTELFPLTFGAQGSFCTAQYAQKTFDLEDDDLSAVRSAEVNGVNASFSSPHEFWADGYVAATPAPYFGGQVIATPMEVHGEQSFGIFSWEPCGPVSVPGISTPTSGCNFPDDPAFALSAFGVSTSAGLRWSRIVGKNLIANQPYAYSCKLPSITRDAINFCGLGSEPEFYRSPLGPDSLPALPTGVKMGQANCACCGNCGCTHCCGCSQTFAFDYVAAEGTPIRAARGGVVKALVTTATDNCWQKPCPGPGGAWGNYVSIQHQDGTAGSYLHMPPQGPTVVMGQHVKRGDVIGQVGNIGNSAAAHTHVQEQKSVSNGTTQLMLYRIARWDGSWSTLNCYTPVTDDLLTWVH